MTMRSDENLPAAAAKRIRSDEQRADIGTVVELFEIDASALGGQPHRFVPGPWNGAPVTYRELVYTPTPVTLSGLGHAPGGAAVRPTLRLSRLNATVAGAVLGAESWQGARLTRLRTLARYLDGQPGKDPNRHWPAETWIVDRLASANRTEVVWELASPLDLEGRTLPGRRIVRDVCGWRYREWNGSEWIDTHAECPYDGAEYFDAEDNPVTDAAEDVCSRRLSGCKLRFAGKPLPFGGFVGVGRVRR